MHLCVDFMPGIEFIVLITLLDHCSFVVSSCTNRFLSSNYAIIVFLTCPNVLMHIYNDSSDILFFVTFFFFLHSIITFLLLKTFVDSSAHP